MTQSTETQLFNHMNYILKHKYLINPNQLLTPTGRWWRFISSRWDNIKIPKGDYTMLQNPVLCFSTCVQSSIDWLRLISDSSQRKKAAILYIKKKKKTAVVSCRGHLPAVDEHWNAPHSVCTGEFKLFLTLTTKIKNARNCIQDCFFL